MSIAQRREFLKLIALGTGAISFPSLGLFAQENSRTTILYSAGSDLDGNYNISAYQHAGMYSTSKLLFRKPLPARAHGVTVHKQNKEVIVFARRPDDFMLVMDAFTGEIKHSLKNDKPLCGHGVFSLDGNTLFTTENDFENQRGVIGVRDVRDNYKKVGEFLSGGVGPHELKLLADGDKLVIANGGILTHPDTGRAKLNLDSMKPSLSYVEMSSGQVIDDFRLAEKHHQLSIRHLDVNQENQVCFVMQYQGSKRHKVPLVGFHKGEETLQLAAMPSSTLKQMKNYCGSVAVDASGKYFAVSSPRGNIMTLWGDDGNFLDSFELNDGCGVASMGKDDSFYFSNGIGEIFQVESNSPANKSLLESNELQRWDNHLTAWHV